jgi:hypothetical protein
MKVMAFDEQSHSTALQAALKSFGEEPITTCKFNFEPVLKDLATTVATARVVENVGVSAYLGGATLITDPVLLDAAGSILTIEARHSTILNVLSAGTAIPSPFDIPMTPSEILALAGPFIDTSSPCDLGIPANVPLTVSGNPTPGSLLSFTATSINGTVPEENLHCNMIIGGEPISRSFKMSECVVPNDVNGPVAIWITSDAQPLVNNIRDRDVVKQVAGPALVFVDTISEALGNAVRTGASAGASGSSSASAGAAAPQATGVSAATQKANQATGNSANNAITVKGWTNLPSDA